jgi:acetamidase/formamidase
VTVLQPGRGTLAGRHHLASTPETVRWGWLPDRRTAAVLEVASGDTVTIDTVSHEGILEDQGRDPVAFFASHGIARADVLDDAIAVAGSDLAHDLDIGPHVVTGPITVAGARPGSVLRVEVLALELRVPYGVVSSRHGFGCLVGELPLGSRRPDASPADPASYGSAFTFVTVEEAGGRAVGVLRYGGGRAARFPLAPFLGVMGVTPDTDLPVPSVPPGPHGGNIDINLTTVGSTLYLPVQVEGAGFYVGDPHYAQGDGEVALTALEAPLRATLRLTVLDDAGARAAVGLLDRPFVETDELWVPVGLDPDLNEAMRSATRAAISFLGERAGMPATQAYAYLSAAADFEVSQVVDGVKGVHCCIRKADFPHLA